MKQIRDWPNTEKDKHYNGKYIMHGRPNPETNYSPTEINYTSTTKSKKRLT